jgi:hypothetical protein
MGQVTIYLEEGTEDKTSTAAETAHLSKSKPVASMIKEKVTTEWPESIVRLAGAWKDLSLAEEDRANLGQDVERAALQARQEAVAKRTGILGKP